MVIAELLLYIASFIERIRYHFRRIAIIPHTPCSFRSQEGATGTEIVLDGGACLTHWVNHPMEGLVGVMPEKLPMGLLENSGNKKRKAGA